jgi:cytochrome d ubiquinol oxidase subunit II
VLFLLLFLVHGSLWLAVKTEGPLKRRAAAMAARLWWPLLLVAALFLFASLRATTLFDNYRTRPALLLIPALAVAALILVYLFMRRGAWWRAWFASCATIVLVTLFGVVGLYPRLLPSSIDPAYSLTIANSASSPLTLKIMLAVALTFVPIVIAYQVWVQFLFKDKAKEEDLAGEGGY